MKRSLQRFRDELFRELVSDTPIGVGMPAIKFFEPNENFLQFMASQYITGRPVIYDVGAGCGHVSKALQERGVITVALDVNLRNKLDYSVIMANGANFPYSENGVVMLCRPCHGPFTEAVITQALSRKVSEILYVGKVSNNINDLGRYRRRFKRVLTEAGKENETVYKMELRRN